MLHVIVGLFSYCSHLLINTNRIFSKCPYFLYIKRIVLLSVSFSLIFFCKVSSLRSFFIEYYLHILVFFFPTVLYVYVFLGKER
mgnify:CR=1 FL=1